MTSPQPVPAVVELLELVPAEQLDNARRIGYLIPNALRINGAHVALPRGSKVRVHEISTDEREPVMVTVTLYASSVRLTHEANETE